MRTFRDTPIRKKLLIIVMVTTTAAMLLAGLGIFTFDSVLYRRGLERDLSALAQIIADNSTAALSFNDPEAAAQTLAALRARPHLVSACIYRPDATVLARYVRAGQNAVCPPINARDENRFGARDVTVSRGIVLNGRRIGTLALLYDLGEIFDRMKLFSATVLGVLMIASLLALLLLADLRETIATPISRLVHASTWVRETSDYSIRAQRYASDELGVLVDRFNEMLAGIQSRDENLRTALRERGEALHDAEKARERFRFLAESMPQKIFTATPTGEVDYYNRQWMEFCGLSFEQMRDWGWTQFVHPDDLEENTLAWQRSIETGEPFSFQHRFRRADGEYRWHLSRAHAMRDVAGNISMWIGSNTDIHEQKEKEEELRRANDDLQQFAYSASHDLQEPIRNVVVYSELISRRYHEQLDADGEQFLGFLTEGGQRLATLIRDLLAYTRAGMMENYPVKVDAAAVLQETLSSLSEALRESAATVTFDALPEAMSVRLPPSAPTFNTISGAPFGVGLSSSYPPPEMKKNEYTSRKSTAPRGRSRSR